MSYIPFKLERFFAQYEFSCKYLMCASDCESLSIHELMSISSVPLDSLGDIHLGYTESQGSPELRAEISSLYVDVASENILVLAGAEEGIYITMRSLLIPGDNIIVQTPCYQSLISVAEIIGVEVTKWVMEESKNWDLDIQFLNDNITPRTKMIIINFPHNPTGAVISHDKFLEIIQIARDNNLILFSDEVYRYSEFNTADRLPAAVENYEKAISLGVMSKSFGLAGLRVGWIAIRNLDLLSKISGYKDYTTICTSAPSEQLSLIALKSRNTLLDRNLKIILENLSLFETFVNEFSENFEWSTPKGSSIGFVRYKKGSVSEFCKTLLQETGILLLPSTEFDFGDSHFRVGLGRKEFVNGLTVLRSYLINKNFS